MHTGEHCGETHRYPISAALCCDTISNTINQDA